jgi:hypothetical protein
MPSADTFVLPETPLRVMLIRLRDLYLGLDPPAAATRPPGGDGRGHNRGFRNRRRAR